MEGDCCPISRDMVNENIVRLNAFLVFLLALAFLLLQEQLIMLFLFWDFLIRAFWRPQYSPVRFVSSLINKAFGWQPHMVNAAPKIFAAKVGFFCVAVVLLYALNPGTLILSRAVAVILMLCAALESLFKYCVGCTLYSYYIRFFPPK